MKGIVHKPYYAYLTSFNESTYNFEIEKQYLTKPYHFRFFRDLFIRLKILDGKSHEKEKENVP